MKRLFLLFVLLIVVVTGCAEDNDPVAVKTPKTYFSLDFIVGDYYGTPGAGMTATFLGPVGSTIPEVIINGESMEYWAHGGILPGIRGELHHLAIADSAEFSITLDGKTTTGKIALPQLISGVTCNDQSLDHGNNQVLRSSDYEFEWSEGAQDRYRVTWSAFDRQRDDLGRGVGFQAENSFSIPHYSNVGVINFVIDATTGPQMEPGAVPNFDGAYGAGWVQAETIFRSRNQTYTTKQSLDGVFPGVLDADLAKENRMVLFLEMVNAQQ